MKKITKPASPEEFVYYSDFKGRCFEFLLPEIEVIVNFNYNSSRDGEQLTLHLTEAEYRELESFLSKKLLPEVKSNLKIK